MAGGHALRDDGFSGPCRSRRRRIGGAGLVSVAPREDHVMSRKVVSGSWLFLACVALALATSTPARADEGGGRGKGKGQGPQAKPGTGTTLQLDESKLPPELLKQLRKYTDDSGKKGGAGPGAKGHSTLPPGLARKPAAHPGRANWLSAHGAAPGAKGKGPGRKGGKDD